jgi:hypothetical protein
MEALFETIYDNDCVKCESNSGDKLASHISQQVFHRNAPEHRNRQNAFIADNQHFSIFQIYSEETPFALIINDLTFKKKDLKRVFFL